MRNIGAILLVLALLGVFMLPGLGRQPSEVQGVDSADLGPIPGVTGTPRAALPLIYNPPTNTPTRTPTATATATQTSVPTATRTGVPGSALTGRLIFVEPKTDYYTHIEWIKFWEQIQNPTGNPIAYSILGVNVSGPLFLGNNARFHTSWTGAPDWILSGCWGPNGNTDWNLGHTHRCAPNQNEGFHQDHVGDASNVEIEQPGHYWIEFWACLSSHEVCTGGGAADWRKLGNTLEFNAHTPPAGAQSAVATPMPQTTCGLITDDPNNIYLECKDGL